MTIAAPPRGTRAKSPVTAYAESVVAGEIVAGWLVRLACERHLRDLKRTDIWFDEAAAQRFIDFFGFLKLSGGDVNAEPRPFKLEPWECFIGGSLFGWKMADGLRRFRVAYVEIGKGNGKSPFAAGTGLYMTVADGEERAEVYSAAVDLVQAQISFRDAVAMVDRSPTLDARLVRSGGKGKEWNLAHLATGSFFRPFASEHTGGRGKSGFRVHCGILDELHEHPTSIMADFMRANAKGRQPLILEITNSGTDRQSVCYHHHDLSVRVLEGTAENDEWFAFVCGLDPCEEHRLDGKSQPQEGCENCDDWRDEAVWAKPNPNLGVSITPRYLRGLVTEAVTMPSKQNIVQRLNFCIWTQAETRWISDELWAANGGAVNAKALAGKAAYAGVVVSASMEMFALVLWVPDGDGGGDVVPFFWVPEHDLEARSQRDQVPYRVWADEGLVELVEGEVLDFEDVRTKLNELADVYDIREVGVMRYNAVDLMTKLQTDGFEVYQYTVHMKDMSAPTKELEKMLVEKTLRHNSNPVLRYQMANVAVKVDKDEHVRPDKEASKGRFDGIEGLIVAIGRAISQEDDGYAGVTVV
jgi:phage terminase large subunit-like protein